MNIEIIEERYNPILKRREIKALISHEGKATPSKEEIKNFASQFFNTSLEKIEICKIFSKMGIGKSDIKIRIWDTKVPKKENKKPKDKEELEKGNKQGEK
jgi:small subunit ribosomal protein S24e